MSQKQRSLYLALGVLVVFILASAAGVYFSQIVFSQPEQPSFDPVNYPTPGEDPSNRELEGDELVRIELGFPTGLDACNTGVLVFMPNEVDPYQLPPIVSVDEWFNRHNFVQEAITQVNITSRAKEGELDLENRIFARVVGYEPLSGPVHAIYAACEEAELVELPLLKIDRTATEFSKEVGEVERVKLLPASSESYPLQLTATEPGLYEILLGVEYTYQEQVYQSWASKSIFIRVPEQITRWSGNLLVQRGECQLEQGEYACEMNISTNPADLARLQSLANTPVPSQAVIPENNPPACPGTYATQLTAGQDAQVSRLIGAGLRVREAPGTNSTIISAISPRTQVQVIEGPACATGYLWWKILTDKGLIGWSAEVDQDNYYLLVPFGN